MKIDHTPKEKKHNTIGWIIGISAVLGTIISLLSVHFHNENKEYSRLIQTYDKQYTPPEEMLASIDKGYTVSADEITVKRFKSLLGQLSLSFLESQHDIADMTVAAKDMLNDRGINETLLRIMEGANRYAFPIRSYTENLSMYVVLRNQGMSHIGAMMDLETALKLNLK